MGSDVHTCRGDTEDSNMGSGSKVKFGQPRVQMSGPLAGLVQERLRRRNELVVGVVFGRNFEKGRESSRVCLNPVSYPLGDLAAVSRVLRTVSKNDPSVTRPAGSVMCGPGNTYMLIDE
ncbi:hypothetical protein IG631_01717 [Alternaria alternata]|nr:hypothetical protein IG631_01717 [Alternaria alternata]